MFFVFCLLFIIISKMPAKIKSFNRSYSHHHPYRPKGVSQRAFHKVYWPYLPLLLIIGLLLSLGGRNSALEQAISHPSSSVLSYADSMQTDELLNDTNDERSRTKLPNLALNTKLAAAAQAKAEDMVSRNYWSHDTPDGSPPWVFATNQLYSYDKLGENLAAGFRNESSILAGWMASSSHRQNILDLAYSEVGFGVAQSPNYSAAGSGPMTVVVAFYGDPSTSTAPTIGLVKGAQSPSKTTVANLALASLPFATIATNLAVLILLGAIAAWLWRHVRSFRRAVKKGENFVFSHPLFDIGLLIIATVGYLLTQTAGLIH
ncbi:TPA: hypothetical protein DIS56_03000 [Candidatus Saccharibacteria bacterium]|nr:MAG: SCP-like protein extracellular [Candidatus Saccharibacteria bacterium GW2011_GWA2_46_10]HCM52074.1 hypothetical protein [Candidatus Saccharibacteria bacterium]